MLFRSRTSGYDPITDTYGTFDLGIDYHEAYEKYIGFTKLRYIVNEVIIYPQKITNYDLDLENPKCKDKAVMFERHLGYTKDNYRALFNQIYDLVLDAEAIPQNEDRFGMMYQVDLEIQGVEATQIEIVRTGWLINPNSKQAQLTTLDLLKR